MKAVVVEIKDCAAAVLTDEGRVVRVKNHNYRVGQVIFMKQSMNRKIRFGAVAAAAACVMLLFGGGAYAYYSPASYVSLDVNPSIEYVLNRFDRVLTVIGVNEDGQKFLKKIELEQLGNKKIEDAIAQTVKQLKEDGYFSGEDGGIVISASAKDLKKAEMLAKNLKTDADKAVDDENVTVEAFADGWNRVQEAQELGVTPGKLNLVEKLQDITGDAEKIDVED